MVSLAFQQLHRKDKPTLHDLKIFTEYYISKITILKEREGNVAEASLVSSLLTAMEIKL